jgi:DNA/RNA endonuclease G (NUC1)
MKIITLIISLGILFLANSQVKPHATITNAAYTSYIDTVKNMPVYVTYKLYKGGGNCERSNKWINDSKYKMIGDESYAGSGYEKGHLANAEDFAYNCHLDSLTFNTYNRIPQTKALNRGIWKKQETLIRKMSQTDSLLITCGAYWDLNTINSVKGMAIPSKCWKVVYSLSTRQVLSSSIFTNSENPTEVPMTIENLELYLGYSINLPKPKSKNKSKKK